jgi:hypothetical protein
MRYDLVRLSIKFEIKYDQTQSYLNYRREKRKSKEQEKRKRRARANR